VTAVSPSQMHHRLHEHLARFWPNRERKDFRWTIGRIVRTLPDFRVIRIAAARREAWTYISSGAWVVRSGHAQRFEFVIQSPVEDAIHVETLAMVANFYADPRYNLHLGSVINIGRPWLAASGCDHFLVSLPYPWGPELEHLACAGIGVRLLWLCPVTAAEAAYAREKGAEVLEQLFEQAAIDYLDVDRKPVVTR
jgi:hypothetical protein